MRVAAVIVVVVVVTVIVNVEQHGLEQFLLGSIFVQRDPGACVCEI